MQAITEQVDGWLQTLILSPPPPPPPHLTPVSRATLTRLTRVLSMQLMRKKLVLDQSFPVHYLYDIDTGADSGEGGGEGGGAN